MQQSQKKRIVFTTWGAALFESATHYVKEEQSVTKSNLRQAELAETVSS